MSKYTTEVRFICETFSGLDESKGCFNINEIIEQSRSKIFNFDYPIFDEKYRGVLETKILKPSNGAIGKQLKTAKLMLPIAQK